MKTNNNNKTKYENNRTTTSLLWLLRGRFMKTCSADGTSRSVMLTCASGHVKYGNNTSMLAKTFVTVAAAVAACKWATGVGNQTGQKIKCQSQSRSEQKICGCLSQCVCVCSLRMFVCAKNNCAELEMKLMNCQRNAIDLLPFHKHKHTHAHAHNCYTYDS